MRELIRKILGKKYRPLNLVEINKKHLISNYRELSKISPKIKIAPVLKSNAYGHGLLQIAKVLDYLKAPFICVDSLYEAYELYKAKIQSNVLIMGYIDPDNLKVKKLPFSYAVYDLKLLEVINKYQKGASVHIKVDTGMNRLGVKVEDLLAFAGDIKKFSNIKIEGLMSHFASSESDRDDISRAQIKNFKRALSIIRSLGITPKWQHVASSSSLLNLSAKKIQAISNVARVGLALYGINGENKKIKLKPVLSLKTRIVQIKDLRKAEKVGYGGTFTAKSSIKLGVLPLGYNDCLDRRLSNKGEVIVNGHYCPIVGIVSMNITTIDVTNVPRVEVGSEVIVFSNNQSDLNSVSNIAKITKTIPYDILVRITPTIRREVV